MQQFHDIAIANLGAQKLDAQCIECTFDAEIRHLRADHRAAQIAVGVLPLRDDVKDLIAIDNIAVRIDKQTAIGVTVQRNTQCCAAALQGDFPRIEKIGRASCRERVCQYVQITVVAVSVKKQRQANFHESESSKP